MSTGRDHSDSVGTGPASAPPSSGLSVLARTSLSLLWAAWASVTLVATAHAEQVIGPGQEGRVLALFAPAAMGDEVVAGYRLHTVVIRAREIDISLEDARRPADPPTTFGVRLVERDSAVDEGMVSVAESDSFELVADRDVVDAHRAVLEQLAERVRQNDDGDFWSEAATVAAGPGSADGSGTVARYAAAAAVIAAVLAAAAWAVARRRRRGSKDVE